MTAQTLFEQIKTYGAENKSIVTVFDLDSTLFNVSYRTQKILFEFAQGLTHQNLREKLLSIYVKQSDWGLKETLLNSGLEYSEFPDFFHQLRDFWMERFFSSRYLHYDVPTRGAVVFAHQLVDLGMADADLIYLTGRDEFRMGPGTREVLKKWNFPEGRVVLKPSKELDDGQFKLDWLSHLISKSNGKTILFFENEPVNINLIGKKFPDVNIIFLNTTHSRRQEIEVPVLEIDHFDTNIEES
jgi:hypothetical protein